MQAPSASTSSRTPTAIFSPTLLDELKGADLIIHAGDLTSEMDYEHLCTIAPVRAVLGNNDYYRDYGPDVDRLAIFTYEASNSP